MGVSEDAPEADSAATWYALLLADRLSSLFECQRQTVYWETAQDHVTVHKTSPEHSLITNAGAYDVSARLLPENMRVDDGWIARKQPDVIVKVVDKSILGFGVTSSAGAQRTWSALRARPGWSSLSAVQNGRVLLLSEELLSAPHLQLFSTLLLARCATPTLFEDTDPQAALSQLTEEAGAGSPDGRLWYTP